MSDSVRPHRWQPTRLPCPWDSPGKNTGVGCHFHLQCTKVKSESEAAQSCSTPSDPMDCSLPGSSVHGTFQARVLEWGAIAFSALTSLEKCKIKPLSDTTTSTRNGWCCFLILTIPTISRDVEQQEFWHTASGDVIWFNHFKKVWHYLVDLKLMHFLWPSNSTSM